MRADGAERVDPAVWRTAFTLIVGALAVVFDTTIVSVAINDLGAQLHAPLSTVQWVSTGYLLAMFVTIPVAGWAQSALGGKRLWLASLGVFLLGSVLCAVAWDAPALIAFRVVQGVGGGMMLPLLATLIFQAAKGRSVGRVMAAITFPSALGPILGPVIGGVILQLGDWRWLFLVNVPFCLVGGWLAYRNLAQDAPARGARLDLVGLLLVSPGVIGLVYGLSQVAGAGGFASAGVLVPLLAGATLICVFVGWALRRGASALVDIRLFRHRALTSGTIAGFFAGVTLFGAMLLLPLYFQQLRGADALGAGLLLIPQGVGTILSQRVAGRLTDRLGPRRVALWGFVIVVLATIPFAFVGADTNVALLLAALFVRGIGMGVAVIPLSSASFIGLAHDEIPHASIITRVASQIGGSIGTAVLAVVLQAGGGGIGGGGAVAGFDHAFWWATVFTAAAIPVCFWLPGRGAPSTNAAVTPDAAAPGRSRRAAR